MSQSFLQSKKLDERDKRQSKTAHEKSHSVVNC